MASTCSVWPRPSRCSREPPIPPPPAARRRRDRRRRAACRSAAATCSTWPPSSAPRCSSTTRPTSGPAAARRSPPSAPARHLRHQGVPVPGHGPPGARGGPAPRRGHRRRDARGPGRRRARPTASCCTATTSRSTSWPPALTDGVRPHRRRHLRRARPARAAPRRRPARGRGCCCASRPASRPTPTSSCAPARTTRSSASVSPAGVAERRHRAGPAVGAGRARRPAHPHRQPDLRRRVLRPGRRGHGPARRRPRPRPSCRSAAASAWPTSRASRRRPSPSGARSVREALRRRRHPASGSSVEPGRAIVAGAAVTLYTVGTIKEIPGIRTYVAVDGGMSDNPRPVLYGSGYEAFLPRGRRRRAAAPRRGWSASTASRATCWCTRRSCPTTSPWATSCARRSPAPTATRWAPTTTRCPGRRCVFVAGRRGPPRGAARDLRRPHSPRRRLTATFRPWGPNVNDLDLPYLDLLNAQTREERRLLVEEVRQRRPLAGAHAGRLHDHHLRRLGGAPARPPLPPVRGEAGRAGGPENAAFFAQRRPSILTTEGDEHGRLRRIVAPAFTPKAADRLRPYMREVMDRLLDPHRGDGPPRAGRRRVRPLSRSRSSAGCWARRRRTGSCSPAGPPTCCASSTSTSPRTCRSSPPPRTRSAPTSAR